MSQTVFGFPRLPLISGVSLVAFALLAAGVGRIVGATEIPVDVAALQSRDLRFEDRADGAVAVYDVKADARPIQIAVGENGFLRGTLRSLARERRRDGIGPQPPFRLTAWADGRLTLQDLATGNRVELEAFGPTNEAVFAELLTVKAATP